MVPAGETLLEACDGSCRSTFAADDDAPRPGKQIGA